MNRFRQSIAYCGCAIFLLAGGGCASPRLTLEDLRASVPPPVEPASGWANTIAFAVYGDNRLSRDRKDRDYGSPRRKRRRAVTSAIAAAAPAFVVHTGDLVERATDPELWTAFKEDTAPLIRPRFFYPAVGNHEYKGGLSDTYLDLFGETLGGAKSYAFRAGPAYFIVLNSVSEPAPGARDSLNFHARWFRERLEEATESRFLFVALHHPIFSSGRGRVGRFLFDWGTPGHAPRLQERRLRDLLVDHLERRRDRDVHARTVVFTGHSHFYEQYAYRGVDFVVTGGGGAPAHIPVERPPLHRVAAYRGDHFVLVKLTGDRVDFRLKPVGPGAWVQEEVRE